VKKSFMVLIVMLFCLIPCICLAGDKEVKILKFYTDPVSIYETEDSFNLVPKKELPDPGKTNVVITNYDRSTSMVMFTHNSRDMWVPQAEVDLSEKAVASIVCGDSRIANKVKKSDTTTGGVSIYSQMGLGEGCK